jgi:diguanylate cyclase (GGDEF)-like protein
VLLGRDESVRKEVDGQVRTLLDEVEPLPATTTREAPGMVTEPLASREAFDSELRANAERLSAEGKGFAVLVFDLDRFREINDFHGHPVGDLILDRVARILQENVRDGDVVARLEGEEFGVISPDLDIDQAGEVAERLRLAVEKGRMPERVRGVTVSVGVAAATRDPGSADVLTLASRALEDAKKSGRNCVCRAR